MYPRNWDPIIFRRTRELHKSPKELIGLYNKHAVVQSSNNGLTYRSTTQDPQISPAVAKGQSTAPTP
jgi:hypothetical protein